MREAFFADYRSSGRTFHRELHDDWPHSLRWPAAEEQLLAEAVESYDETIEEIQDAAFSDLLDGHTVGELRSLAKEQGVAMRSDARKADLVAAIIGAAPHLEPELRTQAIANVPRPEIDRRRFAALLYRKLCQTAYRLRRILQIRDLLTDRTSPSVVEISVRNTEGGVAPCGWQDGQTFTLAQFSLVEARSFCPHPDCACDFSSTWR